MRPQGKTRWTYTILLGKDVLRKPLRRRRYFPGICFRCGCPHHSSSHCPVNYCDHCQMFGHDFKVCKRKSRHGRFQRDPFRAFGVHWDFRAKDRFPGRDVQHPHRPRSSPERLAEPTRCAGPDTPAVSSPLHRTTGDDAGAVSVP